MSEPEPKPVRVSGNTRINGKGIPFVAGLEICNERCVRAAPILWWAKGRPADWWRAEFTRRGLIATISSASDGNKGSSTCHSMEPTNASR